MIEITMQDGKTVKQVVTRQFKALDGWDIQQKFIEFAAATDKQFRREFTLEILGYASVIVGGNELPLTTDALIDNHVQSWSNIQKIFEEVLYSNGIDPKTHADNPNYWVKAGQEMAIAFIAEATKLIGPALQIAERTYVKPE
jgi:hypothetical protein